MFKVHYIATRSTVLQGMPYLTPKEHKPNTLKHDWKETCLNCRKILNDGDRAQTYLDFELVYGGAGWFVLYSTYVCALCLHYVYAYILYICSYCMYSILHMYVQ